MSGIEKKIENLQNEMKKGFEKMGEEIGEVRKDMRVGFDGVDKRFEIVDKKFEFVSGRFKNITDQLNKL